MRTSADMPVPTDPSGRGCTASPAPFPQNTPIAMAYIPFQQFGELYPFEKGLKVGTIFPDLDKPFLGGGALR